MTAEIDKRNAAKKAHEQAPSEANRAKLRVSKQGVKDLALRCKGAWIQLQALGIKKISRGTSHAWKWCKLIYADVDGQLAPRVGVAMRYPNALDQTRRMQSAREPREGSLPQGALHEAEHRHRSIRQHGPPAPHQL